MPKEDKKNEPGAGAAESQAASGPQPVSKPQLLRVSTIVGKHGIDSAAAAAVMTANRLKPTSRIEPGKFLKLMEQFKLRKIKKIGRR